MICTPFEQFHVFVNRESNLPVAPRREVEILKISSENEYSKTSLEELHVEKGFIYMKLHSSGYEVPCPLSQPWKGAAGVLVEPKTGPVARASVPCCS